MSKRLPTSEWEWIRPHKRGTTHLIRVGFIEQTLNGGMLVETGVMQRVIYPYSLCGRHSYQRHTIDRGFWWKGAAKVKGALCAVCVRESVRRMVRNDLPSGGMKRPEGW